MDQSEMELLLLKTYFNEQHCAETKVKIKFLQNKKKVQRAQSPCKKTVKNL